MSSSGATRRCAVKVSQRAPLGHLRSARAFASRR
jgi:hypothetical protein